LALIQKTNLYRQNTGKLSDPSWLSPIVNKTDARQEKYNNVYFCLMFLL